MHRPHHAGPEQYRHVLASAGNSSRQIAQFCLSRICIASILFHDGITSKDCWSMDVVFGPMDVASQMFYRCALYVGRECSMDVASLLRM